MRLKLASGKANQCGLYRCRRKSGNAFGGTSVVQDGKKTTQTSRYLLLAPKDYSECTFKRMGRQRGFPEPGTPLLEPQSSPRRQGNKAMVKRREDNLARQPSDGLQKPRSNNRR
uniref:Uncharacterized protein n=1 Tax=Sphaerodactylus townsendi TaxID=933632 RepID=A0ACB8G5S1_9SAUR